MFLNFWVGEWEFRDDCEVVVRGTIDGGLVMGWHIRKRWEL